VATTKSAATTATMSSGQGIRRNRHRADQQSRSSHNTKITLHEYLQWFDQFTLIIHEHISGSAAGTTKLAFRKLNSILSEQVERAGTAATQGKCSRSSRPKSRYPSKIRHAAGQRRAYSSRPRKDDAGLASHVAGR
jgi:hypothetical protein